jgi:hypothetical protein
VLLEEEVEEVELVVVFIALVVTGQLEEGKQVLLVVNLVNIRFSSKITPTKMTAFTQKLNL